MNTLYCPDCQSPNLKVHSRYHTLTNGERKLMRCMVCDKIFSETSLSAMYNVKSPLSKIAAVLKVRSEGMGLNATTRCFEVSKETIITWEKRFVQLKDTLRLYHFCHQFIKLAFEGDEVYTRVHHNRPASESEGWSIFLMERASRFILVSECGPKDQDLFFSVIEQLALMAEYCDELTLFTDGEQRYGNLLFELCHIWIGQKGKAVKALPPNVQIRIKNKSSARKGTTRPKYQGKWLESTAKKIENEEIHANHLESHFSSLRRTNSCFRRRTNTYAKNVPGLQRTLDGHQIMHNYVKPHFTTGKVPAVALGVLKEGFTLEQLLTMQRIPA